MREDILLRRLAKVTRKRHGLVWVARTDRYGRPCWRCYDRKMTITKLRDGLWQAKQGKVIIVTSDYLKDAFEHAAQFAEYGRIW